MISAVAIGVNPTSPDASFPMSKKRLHKLLEQLGHELDNADDIDDQTREMLDELHDDIDRLTGDTHDNAIDLAKRLESRFAAHHPVAERIAREFADLLAKMGI